MNYTTLTKELDLELGHIKKDAYNFLKCMEHPSYFAHHVLGITPYKYQHLILRRFADNYRLKNKRTIIVKSRQIGISTCLAILAIWYAAYNKANTGIHKNTKIGIISRSDEQAKKLMREIQNLCWNSKYDFNKLIMLDRKSPLNKKELHFKSGWIKCFPPTDACRGEALDFVFVDEAAFVESDIFRDAIEPTVSHVDGKIILSSTPNGQKGFFFETFDPFDMLKEHEYERFWFNWEMCENQIQRRMIEDKLVHAKETGNVKSFDQEYGALFTVDEEAFFEDGDVERGINQMLVSQFEWKLSPCSIGLDYGYTNSATSITVTTLYLGKIIMLYQRTENGLDDNLLMDHNWEDSIPNLYKRYNVQHVVVDDCAQGVRTNKELENKGYPVIKFNFRTDQVAGERNRGYYLFRSYLRIGKIKYPEFRKLMGEMKSMQEIKMQNTTRVKAPVGSQCDRIDSFMMSTYPFLTDENSNFSSTVLAYDEVLPQMAKKILDGRHDSEWEHLNTTNNPYDFLLTEENIKEEKKEEEEE